jgi:hypothetical protein
MLWRHVVTKLTGFDPGLLARLQIFEALITQNENVRFGKKPTRLLGRMKPVLDALPDGPWLSPLFRY